MYSYSQALRGFRNPTLISQELNRLYYTRFRQWKYNKYGTDIFNKDWDNLVILDACRNDALRNVLGEHSIDTSTNSVTSRGSATKEFLRGNFHGRDLRDTVYVTSTTVPYRESVLKDRLDLQLHDIVDVWRNSINAGEFGITPNTMTDAALDAAEQYPNKRLIIHYIQPHIPFLGPSADLIPDDFPAASIWAAKRSGSVNVSDETIWTAYIENLEIVIDEVESLRNGLIGKTVITSDHGQLIGDNLPLLPVADYGHPAGVYVPELVKVPWLIFSAEERRDIFRGESTEGYNRTARSKIDEDAKDHLRDLGYL